MSSRITIEEFNERWGYDPVLKVFYNDNHKKLTESWPKENSVE